MNNCIIPLTQDKSAVVSPEDYEFLTQWKWWANKSCVAGGRFKWYAYRTKRQNGNSKNISMHREIARRSQADFDESKDCDHVDGDGLNNTRDNIRLATRSQNIANSIKVAGTSSRFKGVYWSKASRKWAASIKVNYKSIHLGLFSKEEDAGQAYLISAKEHFGEFAYLPRNSLPAIISS
jgi:hypothetical protein